MSTLKVNTLQDAAGANQSTAVQIQQGRAKAWINFNGTGTVATRDNFNISSLIDNGVGDYTVTFSVNMANPDYCSHGMAYDATGALSRGVLANAEVANTPVVTGFRFGAIAIGVGAADYDRIMLAIQGD